MKVRLTVFALAAFALVAAVDGAWHDKVINLVEQLYSAQNAQVAEKDRGRTFHRKGRCASVTVDVDKNVPDEFKVGFLKDAGSYKGYLRLSNGDGVSRSDMFDVRGAGLVVAGVKGKKLNEGEGWEKETQNFIGINYPLFVANNETIIPFFEAAIKAKKGSPFDLLAFMAKTPMTRRVVLTNVAMPPVGYLNNRYWSQAAFRVGQVNTKYSLIPCGQKAFSVPLTAVRTLKQNPPTSIQELKALKGKVDNILQTNLAEQLATQGPANAVENGCFRLAFQKQINADKMPTDNPQVWWKEPGYFSPIPGVVLPDYLTLADLKLMFDAMKAQPLMMGEKGLNEGAVPHLIEIWETKLKLAQLFNSANTTVKEALEHLPQIFTDLIGTHGPESAFVNVATVHIAKQDIAPLDAFCENLEITPGHSSVDIAPTGAISEIRAEVYEMMSGYRHSDNGTTPFEPTGDVAADLATHNRLNP
ncbi:MAG: hypothetical protein HYZ71_15915 [Deltaproteobacteria bacterium]|nr:hypothetical protein [Deltaproteobacteria bacterium]